jgi:hypothetical protein
MENKLKILFDIIDNGISREDVAKFLDNNDGIIKSSSRTLKSIWVAKLHYFTSNFKTHADSVIREKLKQEKQTPQQIAKEVLNEILSPTPPPKKTNTKAKN